MDASAGSSKCGFGDVQTLQVSSAGWAKTLTHEQKQGWTSLDTFYINEVLTVFQGDGKVDAFRLVKVENCKHEKPSLAALHLRGEYEEITDKAAFLHAAQEFLPWARVLSVSQGSILLGMEVLEEPSEAALQKSVTDICSVLEHEITDCPDIFEFKRYSEKAAAPPAEESGNAYLFVAAVAALLALGLAVRAFGKRSSNDVVVPEVGVVTEKKPSDSDDVETLSTVTPDDNCSLASF